MEKDVLDYEIVKGDFDGSESPPAISILNYSLLYILTFGIYDIWWNYKAWRFLKAHQKLDIMPVARAFFTILFVYSLFERIKSLAISKDYPATYSSGLLFTFIVVFMLTSRLPGYLYLISFLALFCSIPPLKAVNFIAEKLGGSDAIPHVLNTRQIVLMLFGLAFWAIILYGMYNPYYY